MFGSLIWKKNVPFRLLNIIRNVQLFEVSMSLGKGNSCNELERSNSMNPKVGGRAAEMVGDVR